MATTILNGAKSPNGYMAYYLTAEIVARNERMVTLKCVFKAKYLTAKTSKTNIDIWFNFFNKKFENDSEILIKTGTKTRKKGEVLTATKYMYIDSDNINSYNLAVGKYDVIYAKYSSSYGGSWEPYSKYSLENKNSTVSIQIPKCSYQIIADVIPGINNAEFSISNLPTRSESIIKYELSDGKTGTIYYRTASGTYTDTIKNLIPLTTYNLSIKLYINDVEVGRTSVSFTTSNETGNLILNPSSSSIIARVDGMSTEPRYERNIGFELYSTSESKWIVEIVPNIIGFGYYESVEEASVYHLFEGLKPKTKYKVVARIKNGSSTILKELTRETYTEGDVELVPKAKILDLIQEKQSTNIIVKWMTNKNVASTTYTIQMFRGIEWEDSLILDTPVSESIIPLELDPLSTGEIVKVRIKGSNRTLSEDETISDEMEIDVKGTFFWDVDKVVGEPVVITANEWNRLGDYIKKKNKSYGFTTQVTSVSVGQSISAALYNELRQNLNRMVGVNIPEKNPGNPIVASDIDALRVAINMA